MISIKSIETKNLKKKEILKICKLKNTFWKYGLKSNLKWFKSNMKTKDIHNLLYFKDKFVGYSVLRKRTFLIKKVKKKYLYSDTLIIDNRYRNLKLARIFWKFNSGMIIREKIHAFLICEPFIRPFHKKFGWKLLKKKDYEILDYKPSFKNFHAMTFNLNSNLVNRKKIYFVNK